MGRVFVTGDTHGDFFRIYQFCKDNNTTTNDIMIICGDAGINYYLNKKDEKLKIILSVLPITFLIVHGNHEERAWNVDGYIKENITIDNNQIHNVWREEKYPNICFVYDFSMQKLNDKLFMFLGGAYSVDKHYRLSMGYKWFQSEQISAEQMQTIIDWVKTYTQNKKIDCVVTHTCPLKYEPTEAFLAGIDQSTVDKRTEIFLDEIEELVDYENWCCGHFHINKAIDKIRFLFDEIIEVG